MNRIDTLFQEKKNGLLSIYFTAGYPELNDTRTVIKEAAAAGADLLEIGIPFSDSMVDGPTILASNKKALENGMNLQLLFDQLQGIRKEVDIPLIMMGYLNTSMQFGMEKFCQECEKAGIDGVILPDLPAYEYQQEFKSLFEKHGLYNIFLITPQTPDDRIRELDEMGAGFIYMVSSASTTGAKESIASSQVEYFERINTLGLKNPRLIGFGISDNKTFTRANEYASGAIIGSAFIRAISKEGELKNNIHTYISSVLNA